MEKSEIIQKVNEFLIDEFEVDESKISPDSNLKTDLGIDSLDFIDIAIIVEKTFKFKIKAEDLVNVSTLDNFYDYIQANCQ
jgi:acyl carrier protein